MGSSNRLCDHYDVAMFDLDGVLYIGGAAVPGAAEHVAGARAAGMRCAFVTNNAARRPAAVAAHLSELGIRAAPEDVVTSAQAAARLLRERFDADAPIAVLGADGLTWAVEAAGLRAVDIDDDAVAIVTGYGPDVSWRQIMRTAVRVRDGLPWVASNRDLTIPTAFGTAPGHGVLVQMIAEFAGVRPAVAGKPEAPLLQETIQRTGAQRPLMIGDRLDTDIAGATAIGVDSLLVMTGVTGVDELRGATRAERPTHIADDLGALLEDPDDPASQPARWRASGFDAG